MDPAVACEQHRLRRITEGRNCDLALPLDEHNFSVWLDVPALGGKMRDDKFDLPTSSWWILGFTALVTLLAVVMGMAQVLAT